MTMLDKNPIPKDFIEDLVNSANAVAKKHKGAGIDVIRGLVNEADVVIGIYQDKTQPYGIGMHIIKGHRLLMTVATEHKSKSARWLGLPCRDLDEAGAFQDLVGEPDPMH